MPLDSDVMLQPHQQRVVDRMQGGDQRMLLYHGLGSGKSLASLDAAEAAGQPYAAVVPAALRTNYRKEREHWTDQKTPADVLSYTQAGSGAQPNVPYKTLILDEAQRIRNPATSQAKAISQLASKADRLMLLSGSPIVNAPGDLAVPTILLTGSNYTPKSFKDQFVANRKISPGLWARLRGVQPEDEQHITRERKLRRLLAGHVDYQPSKMPEDVSATDTTIDRELSPNTARQVISTVSAKVFFKGGRPRCSGRFLANLDILRLTTRGLTRLRRGSSRFWAISSGSSRYHRFRPCGVTLSHSGNRACRICRQPVKDNRSTSRLSCWAASSISARTTKWPSDKDYNSCSTPAGV